MSYISNFKRDGYAGPFPLLSVDEGLKIVKQETIFSNVKLPYVKGRHILSKNIASLASRPEILEKIIPLLGPDVLLSGSQIIRQRPKGKHEWHVDIEHIEWEGVTVWLALSNVKRNKCIRVISGSHLFEIVPDDLKQQGIDISNDDQVLKEVQQISAAAELVELNISDGEFIVFDGKTWHGTKNMTSLNRYAAIFQYCNTSQKVKILDSTRLPKVVWQPTVPNCLLVNGADTFAVNKIIPRKDVGNLKNKLQSVFFHLPKNVMKKQHKLLFFIKALLAPFF